MPTRVLVELPSSNSDWITSWCSAASSRPSEARKAIVRLQRVVRRHWIHFLTVTTPSSCRAKTTFWIDAVTASWGHGCSYR